MQVPTVLPSCFITRHFHSQEIFKKSKLALDLNSELLPILVTSPEKGVSVELLVVCMFTCEYNIYTYIYVCAYTSVHTYIHTHTYFAR